jgi:hypothetical protein
MPNDPLNPLDAPGELSPLTQQQQVASILDSNSQPQENQSQQSIPSNDQSQQSQPSQQDQSQPTPGSTADLENRTAPIVPSYKPVSPFGSLLLGALSGLANHIKGMGEGAVLGGIPGAVEGAVAPNVVEQTWAQKQQINANAVAASNAQVRFENARAAASSVQALAENQRFHQMSQDWKNQQEDRGLQQVTYFKNQGINPIMVVHDDDAGNNAMAALQHLSATRGSVPSLYVAHIQNNLVAYDVSQIAASPSVPSFVNDVREYQNLTPLDPAVWAKMSPADRQSLTDQSLRFFNPVPEATPQKISQQISNYRSMRTAYGIAHSDDDADTLKGNLDKFDTVIKSLESARDDLSSSLASAAGAKTAAQQQAKAANPTTQSDEWKPKVTADEKKKAELAENIAYNSNSVANIILRRSDLLGAGAGRLTNVEQMVGNNDRDISALGTAIHNIAMANSGVHGFRSNEGVKDTESKILNNFKNGPAAVAGALRELTGSVQTFIDDARPENYKTHSKQGGAIRAMRGNQ